METISTNVKDRVLQIAENKGIAKEKFFKDLSVSYGNFKGKSKTKALGSDTLAKIVTMFSDINTNWLLTGEGAMLKSGEVKNIPFYDAEVIGGREVIANSDAVSEPAEMIDAGDWFRDADGAMRVYGNSMQPKYPAGCIIAFRKITDWELIVNGKDYVIETSEYRIIKRLQKNDGHVMASSYNEEADATGAIIHSSFKIPLDKIKRLFSVLGKVEREESTHILYNSYSK